MKWLRRQNYKEPAKIDGFTFVSDFRKNTKVYHVVMSSIKDKIYFIETSVNYRWFEDQISIYVKNEDLNKYFEIQKNILS